MAMLLEGKGLLLHIPKTGGSWVRHVLREQGLVKMEWPHPHPDLDRVLNLPRYYPLHFAKQSVKHQSLELYWEIQESYKFCFVRHPHSWYESYWRFMQGLGWERFHKKRQRERTTLLKRSWHPTALLEQVGDRNFNSFLRAVLESYPGYLTQMYGWYASPGEIDFVGRTESLVDDLLVALDQADIDVDEEMVQSTEKVNTSPSRIDRPTWDDDLRAAVRRLEAPVFERFGYE
jgi:hypothetical protein